MSVISSVNLLSKYIIKLILSSERRVVLKSVTGTSVLSVTAGPLQLDLADFYIVCLVFTLNYST